MARKELVRLVQYLDGGRQQRGVRRVRARRHTALARPAWVLACCSIDYSTIHTICTEMYYLDGSRQLLGVCLVLFTIKKNHRVLQYTI